MAFGSYLTTLFQIIIIYGYPGFMAIKTAKEGNINKIWIIYFLIIGLLSIIEGILLFPIIFILDKISKSIFPLLKTLFHLWLYHPEFRGALLIDQQFGKFIDLAFLKMNPIIGKFSTLFGVPYRDTSGIAKKIE